MTNSQIVQATFGASMTVNTPQNGTVQLNPFQTAYPFGSSLQISAIPSPGYYFGLWGGSASGVTNPFPMTITAANPTVSALFAALSAGHYSLTVIPNGIGTLGISPRANSFASNASVTVTATPSGTNQFYYWTGSVTSSVNPLTLAMNTNKTITANFSGGKYPIQFSPILT